MTDGDTFFEGATCPMDCTAGFFKGAFVEHKIGRIAVALLEAAFDRVGAG